jgi:hypothetical protein
LWKRELWLNRKLILVYPGHEALWIHRRFVMDHWIKVILPDMSPLTATFYDSPPHEEGGGDEEKEEEEEMGFKPEERGEDDVVVLAKEARFIARCCTDDTQERFEAQREAGRAYLAWLARYVLPKDRRLLRTGMPLPDFDAVLGPRGM